MSQDKPLKIISLGMGVQSTALYFMSAMGELPRVDYAIFADTGREKTATLNYLDFLLDWQRKKSGPPILIARMRNLYSDLLNTNNSAGQRFASIPAFTFNSVDGKEGMLRRQCTGEYKIWQVDQTIRREIYNLAPRKRLPTTEVWKGISFEEIDRMSIPLSIWKTEVYPFCGWITYHPGKAVQLPEWDNRNKIIRRNGLIQWYKASKLPIPAKSSCVFCPYQSDAAWYDLKKNYPSDFDDAVKVDEAIRDSTARGCTQPIFLHRSLKPLREINFQPGQPDLWSGDCSSECHS